MAGVNRVILIGNLGKDPEIFTFENGAKKASFSLATTESYKDKDGNRVDQTEWHNIVLWRGLAEIAEKYLTKGRQIYLEGKIKTRTWDDKDGKKRYTTEIYCDSFTMLGARKNQENESGANVEEPPPPEAKAEDDLPF